MTEAINRERKIVFKKMMLSIILALMSFPLMWLATTLVAWQFTNNSYGIWPEKWITKEFLRQCEVEIAKNASLGNASNFDLEAFVAYQGCSDELLFFQDTDGQWLDGWGRPFLIESDGKIVVVKSLGRDGKPGGTGVDSDLSTEHVHSMHYYTTFSQFLEKKNHNANVMRMSCLIVSISFVFLVIFLAWTVIVQLPKFTNLQTRWLFTQVLSIIILIFFTAIIGGVISQLHVPMIPPYDAGH